MTRKGRNMQGIISNWIITLMLSTLDELSFQE
jgi:hypothetical protein